MSKLLTQLPFIALETLDQAYCLLFGHNTFHFHDGDGSPYRYCNNCHGTWN